MGKRYSCFQENNSTGFCPSFWLGQNPVLHEIGVVDIPPNRCTYLNTKAARQYVDAVVAKSQFFPELAFGLVATLTTSVIVVSHREQA